MLLNRRIDVSTPHLRWTVQVPPVLAELVREIAWKAQTRLGQRSRHMMATGKLRQVVVTAIARELAGFVWSIACVTSDPPAKTSAVTNASEQVGTTGVDNPPRREPLKAARHGTRSRFRRLGQTNASLAGEPDGMRAHHRSTG